MATVKTERGERIIETIQFVMEGCCNCGIPFMLPAYHQRRLIGTQEIFYCPNGHSQAYSGPTKDQQAIKGLKQREAQLQREKEEYLNKYLDEMNAKDKLEKQLKRIHKGVCPCCNRSFQNLKNHMETKHPEVLGIEKKPFVAPKKKK